VGGFFFFSSASQPAGMVFIEETISALQMMINFMREQGSSEVPQVPRGSSSREHLCSELTTLDGSQNWGQWYLLK
jgi:hypothetical protein